MRAPICLLLLVSLPCAAWETPPHQIITRAALDRLPPETLARFDSSGANLIDSYCLLPDLYVEMTVYRFARPHTGLRGPKEIRAYCVRPDGLQIHVPTGDSDIDLASLMHLYERIITSFSEKRTAEAAKYAGVLAHFIEDSLSPPHATGAARLRAMSAADARAATINTHSAIERSVPQFTLNGRKPRMDARRVLDAAETTLSRCYAGAAVNRADLPAMVAAALAGDEGTLDRYRLRAGTTAAEILSDALYTLSQMTR